MNDGIPANRNHGIEFRYELSEPPQKVWRAISMPEFREHWLPKDILADGEATSVTPDEEVSYRMRDSTPPYLESTVTFRIAANDAGGTSLRIIHKLDDVKPDRMTSAAANGNYPLPMLAA